MTLPGVARGRIAALAVLALAGVAAGCSGSDRPDRPRVEQARDRSARIEALERQVVRLKRKTERERRRAASDRATSGVIESGSLDGLVSNLPGGAGVVVGAPGGAGPRESGGDLLTGAAWSTIKVPIAERVLEDAGGPGNLDPAVKDQITAAITRSDNEAAAALFARLESAHGGLAGASRAVGEMLRAAGDAATVVSTRGRDGFSTYGQTEWSLAGQNRYLAALAGGCVSRPAVREYLLGEMSRVAGSDTFGLGSTGLPARWKGGWGPGTDGRYLVRQMGVIDAGGGPLVVTMAAIPDDGTFESGQAILNEIAARVAARFSGRAPARRPC